MAGKYTLHDVTSGNGQKLIQFAQMNEVCTEHRNTNIIKKTQRDMDNSWYNGNKSKLFSSTKDYPQKY